MELKSVDKQNYETNHSHYSVWLQTGWTGFDLFVEANYLYSSLFVQTSSEAHPASYTMGTRGPFPGAWRCPI
jgi:hypothetical protein